ncbi:Centromere protein I [Yarrowia sp. B02]|nr:Centromere protein I [Yarrowia sp. B02]
MSLRDLLAATEKETCDTLSASLTLEINNSGLSPEHVDSVVKTLVSSSCPAFLANQLPRLLIPNKPVLSRTVIRISSALGLSPSKPSLKTQISLLKWLCTVHPFLEDGQIVNSLYTVLFNYLNYESLRPYLCSLLFVSTTSEAVQPWRYDTLLQIKNKNRDPRTSGYVDALLTLYSQFKPFLQAPSDMKWSESKTPTVSPDEKLLEKIIHVMGNTNKPILYQSPAQMRDIVAAIDKPMPKQIASVVGNSTLARVFHLKSSQLDDQRLNRWLTQNMDEKKVLEYIQYTKTMPLAVVNYLIKQVKTEDALPKTTWALLSQLPLLNPITFRQAFLEPLAKHPVELVECLTRLLANWTTLEGTEGPGRESCVREIHSTVSSLIFSVPVSSTLSYFETAAYFTIKTTPTRPLIPSSSVIQFYIAHADPSVVSRLGWVLCLLRNGSLSSESYKSAVTEFSSALWSNRHLPMDEQFMESLSSLLRFPVTIDTVFGLTMSSAMSHIAAVYLWSLEEEADIERRHEGPVTAQSLVGNEHRGGLSITNQQYKQGLLDFAADEYGLKGLRDFLYVTMKSLKRTIDQGEASKKQRLSI